MIFKKLMCREKGELNYRAPLRPVLIYIKEKNFSLFVIP